MIISDSDMCCGECGVMGRQEWRMIKEGMTKQVAFGMNDESKPVM